VRRAPNRINWVRQLHTWHWMSSAICLVGLMLFALTGITLNNAQLFEREEPHVQRRTDTVPVAIMQRITQVAQLAPPKLPREADAWLRSAYGIASASQRLDWADGELNISAPRPGGSASIRIELKSGELEFERTDRGLIAYFNDLHKGRHAGAGWGWFLDVFAGAALLSSFTGLLILVRQSSMRRSIWPLVGVGAFVPAIVIFLFVH
jgi:hypothetical protein